MKISLSRENAAFLQAQVDAGLFPSIEEAANRQLDLLRGGHGDLTWAQPYIDAALEAEARGDLAPLDVEAIRKKLHAGEAARRRGRR